MRIVFCVLAVIAAAVYGCAAVEMFIEEQPIPAAMSVIVTGWYAAEVMLFRKDGEQDGKANESMACT